MVLVMKKLLIIILLLRGVQAGEFVLSLNESERYAISEIVSVMGEKNIVRLLLDSSRLTNLGNGIQQVPPLQFLGFIVTNPYLKECLKKISKSTFKWSPFVDGFSANMEKEFSEGRLLEELPEFAKFVGGPLNQMEGYVYQHAWDEFIKCLL